MSEEEKKEKAGSFVSAEDLAEKKNPKKKKVTKAKDANTALFDKLDEIKRAIIAKDQGIAHQLCRIADHLIKGAPEKQLIARPIPSKAGSGTDVGELGKAKMLFPPDLTEMLTFEGAGDSVVIRPRQYLGSDNFAKIASIIREARGEYVSEGKTSHFRIPKSEL